MAVYKVPQDVEADDKLVGPFSFRQFVYLLIAAGAGFVAFVMFQIFPLLVLIPLPILFLFGALALPLRKDQPMETYLLALIRFYFKPKQRLWNPDGTITYVEITAPRLIERHLTKEYGADAARERLDYLARVMDTRGWALKGGVPTEGASVTFAVVAEAQSATDVLDENASLSQSLQSMLVKKDEERRKTVMEHMQGGGSAATPSNQMTFAPAQTQTPASSDDPTLTYNPYPTSMHQKVVQPLHGGKAQPAKQPEPQKPAPASVTPAVSPDIMRLASNDDLTISALAHEAHRLESKDEGEVVINLH